MLCMLIKSTCTSAVSTLPEISVKLFQPSEQCDSTPEYSTEHAPVLLEHAYMTDCSLQLLYMKSLFDVKAAERKLAIDNENRSKRMQANIMCPPLTDTDREVFSLLHDECEELLKQSAYNVRLFPGAHHS